MSDDTEDVSVEDDRAASSGDSASELVLRPSIITIVSSLVGLAAGSYLLYLGLSTQPIEWIPAGVGLALATYGTSQIGWVHVAKGDLRQRGPFNREAIHATEVRKIELGMRWQRGTKLWFPIIVTLDGRSVAFTAATSVRKKTAEKRIKKIREAFRAAPADSRLDPFGGSDFNMTPSYVATPAAEKEEPEEISLTPGYDAYLREKAAAEAAAAKQPKTAPAEAAEPVQAAPQPQRAMAMQQAAPQPVTATAPAPAVFEPQPLQAQPKPAPAVFEPQPLVATTATPQPAPAVFEPQPLAATAPPQHQTPPQQQPQQQQQPVAAPSGTSAPLQPRRPQTVAAAPPQPQPQPQQPVAAVSASAPSQPQPVNVAPTSQVPAMDSAITSLFGSEPDQPAQPMTSFFGSEPAEQAAQPIASLFGSPAAEQQQQAPQPTQVAA